MSSNRLIDNWAIGFIVTNNMQLRNNGRSRILHDTNRYEMKAHMGVMLHDFVNDDSREQ